MSLFSVPSLTEEPDVNIPVDLGSGFLSQDGRVTFLTPNNTHIVAHQGSSIKLECRIDKPPNSAMVRKNISLILSLKLERYGLEQSS